MLAGTPIAAQFLDVAQVLVQSQYYNRDRILEDPKLQFEIPYKVVKNFYVSTCLGLPVRY